MSLSWFTILGGNVGAVARNAALTMPVGDAYRSAAPEKSAWEILVVGYSILSAHIGSTEAARRAGTIAATAAAAKSSTTLPPMASGSITGVW